MNDKNLIWSEWLELQKKLVKIEKEFLQVIENIDEELRDKKFDEDKWTPKDILSHIVGWEVEVVKQFKTFLLNPDVDDEYDIDLFNKSSVESRRHNQWVDDVDELRSAQKELLDFLSTLIHEDLNKEKRFREWVEILVNHYLHHTCQIKQLI
jgi:hypothetical protein